MVLIAGVIGVGQWGSKVAKEYIALMKEGSLDSVVLCDKDTLRLRPFVELCETSNNIEKTLKEVDMVHVCTPNFTHYEVARKALESDLDVLIEKPMANDVNHAYELAELSMKKGKVLQVGHIFRFANVVRKIKQLFESGEFGDQYYFNLEWTHLIPPIDNVDVIYDLLPHPLDIIDFVTGKWPLSFKGVGKTFRRDRLAEVAFVEAIYDGFFANIHLSWVVPTRMRKLEIIGSLKSVTADCVEQTAQLCDKYDLKDIAIQANNTIREEILNFMGSIMTGKSDYNSCIIGARSIEMISQATKSIDVLK